MRRASGIKGALTGLCDSFLVGFVKAGAQVACPAIPEYERPIISASNQQSLRGIDG